MTVSVSAGEAPYAAPRVGFEESRVTFHSQQHSGRPTPMFTVIARRTKPSTQVVGR